MTQAFETIPGLVDAELVALLESVEVDPGELVPRFMAHTVVRPFPDGLMPELKERQLIELTIELANAPDQYDVARAVDRFQDWYGVRPGSRQDDDSDEHWARQQPDQIAARARRQLALIAKERALDGSHHADPVRDELAGTHAPRFVLVAGVTRDADGDFVHHTIFHTTLATAVNYAICLILSRRRPYYGELRQCAYEECGRFFLSSRVGKGKGKRPFKFCPGSDCKSRYHSRTGAERTRKSRAQSRPKVQAKRTNTRKPK